MSVSITGSLEISRESVLTTLNRYHSDSCGSDIESIYASESMDNESISRLPDNVLQHIISFLPTKYAVGTSILAKRWKYLWTSIPNLDFDVKLFNTPKKSKKDQKRKSNFMNFVDWVFILHDVSNLQKFHLKCDDNCDKSRINLWIHAAIRRKVQELNLSIDLNPPFALDIPSCLFTCESLVILKLKIRPYFIDIPTSICFPSLKIFHLESIIFPDDYPTERLFSSCPVLEELVLESCGWQNLQIIRISVPTLKRLTISQTKGESDLISECIVEVNAPTLLSLKFIGCLAGDYCLQDLPSLVDAFIDVEVPFDASEPWEIAQEDHGLCVSRLLSEASNLKVLTISGDTMETLFSTDTNSSKHLPMFHNLKHLELTTYLNRYSIAVWHLLDLLECAPNLEHLVFAEGLKYYNEDWGSLRGRRCLLPHLKSFKIMSFHWNVMEIELVGFLLKNAEVLETMTIVSSDRLSADEKKQKIKAFNFPWTDFFHGQGSRSSKVPQRFLLHLKRGFNGYGEELKLVEFLLKNAKSLERLTISCSRKLLANLAMQKEIEKLLTLNTAPSTVVSFS